MILKKEYFKGSATRLAPDLLGKVLCRRTGTDVIRRRITETECYFGEGDTACHAHKGKTERTKTLYSEGGVTYVYLCYGIHSLLNFVTGEKGHPEAVLIRGVEGASGPGRVTKLLCITCKDNAKNLTSDGEIWVEDDGFKVEKYDALPRVGIDYAEKEDRERLWRFVLRSPV